MNAPIRLSSVLPALCLCAMAALSLTACAGSGDAWGTTRSYRETLIVEQTPLRSSDPGATSIQESRVHGRGTLERLPFKMAR